jgi:hypothetical protein
MKQFSKLMLSLVAGAALLLSGTPASAQGTLTYVSRTAYHLTTAATTTVVSSDAYLVSLVITTSAVGTGFNAKVQNKEGTAKILIPATAGAVGTQSLILSHKEAAIYMKGGIDIITTGTPGVIDVFVTYYKP